MFMRKISGAAIVAVVLMMACAALRAEQPTPEQVVFVCEHGNVKSRMAASYFNEMATKRGLPLRAISRGSAPDSTLVVSAADVAASSLVVAIGTSLPIGVDAPSAKTEHWDDVPAASVNYAAARDSLRAHIEQLLEQMTRAE